MLLDDDLYQQETDPGGGADLGGEPAAAADPPADDTGDVTPDELGDAAQALEPDYAQMFSRPEFQQALGSSLEHVLGGLIADTSQQQQAQAQPGPQLPDLSQLDPVTDPQGYTEGILQTLGHAFGRMLDERLGPYQPALEHTAETQWKAETDNYYQGLEREIGGFDHDTARLLAAGIASLPGDERDPHRAAATRLAALVKQERADAVEEFKKSLPGMAGSTPYEPPVNGAGIAGETRPRDENAAALRWAARQQATPV